MLRNWMNQQDNRDAIGDMIGLLILAACAYGLYILLS